MYIFTENTRSFWKGIFVVFTCLHAAHKKGNDNQDGKVQYGPSLQRLSEGGQSWDMAQALVRGADHRVRCSLQEGPSAWRGAGSSPWWEIPSQRLLW